MPMLNFSIVTSALVCASGRIGIGTSVHADPCALAVHMYATNASAFRGGEMIMIIPMVSGTAGTGLGLASTCCRLCNTSEIT